MNTIISAILAQTNVPPTLPDSLHTSQAQLWTYAIAVATPLLIQFVKWVVPTVPKMLLPALSPFVGVALGMAFNAVGLANISWVDGAHLGALGVFLRELVDQAAKLRQSQETKAGGA